MHSGLHGTLLLDLPPGAAFKQSSHMVLLRGQLVAPPAVAADGPRALPWLADPRLGLGGAEERPWRAGRAGALCLVWLTAAGEEPAGVAEAAQQAVEAARHGGESAQQRPGGGSSGGTVRRLMPWQHPFVRRPKPADA